MTSDAVQVYHTQPNYQSFLGGRVNATILHHRCTLNEEIHYRDVISEYP